MFDQIAGNEPIKAYLSKSLLENRLPQTLLFSGPEGIGKGLFAKALAAHLLQSNQKRIDEETHPDLHIIRPEGKSGLHSIDTLRTMIDKEHGAPFEAVAKVFILENVERMQPAAANAILKTLEEPSTDTTFILLSASSHEILPTILSRCAILTFHPLSEETVASLLKIKGHSTHFAKFSSGSIGRAIEWAAHPQIQQQQKNLFRLLSQPLNEYEKSKEIEKLGIELEEGKEEDPLLINRRIELFFSLILMWSRDQHLRKLNAADHLLFFPDEPIFSGPLPTLKKIEQAVDESRLAYQRNMKVSVCFSKLLSALAI